MAEVCPYSEAKCCVRMPRLVTHVVRVHRLVEWVRLCVSRNKVQAQTIVTRFDSYLLGLLNVLFMPGIAAHLPRQYSVPECHENVCSVCRGR